MIYELSQKFYFEASHTLHRKMDAEASKRIHGHTYHAEVTLRGDPDHRTGMLVDIGAVRREIARIRDLLDHRLLDEIDRLGPATLENLCRFIYAELSGSFPSLVAVAVERQASGDKCVLRQSAQT